LTVTALTHLLDTSVYSQPLKPAPLESVVSRWLAVGERRLSTSVLCQTELLYGIEKRDSSALRRRFKVLLEGRLVVHDLDAQTVATYARLKARLERLGQPRADFDLLIAATALEQGLILATLNARHFKGIEGLRVEDWSE
jgi:tRNA(fMet)-specific endonuclease VapC